MTTPGNSKSPLAKVIPHGERGEKISSDGHFRTLGDNSGQIDLPDVQLRAIELTVQGQRDTQIAQTLGLDHKTLWNWKTQNHQYRQALALARHHLFNTTIDRCQNAAQQAAMVLAGFLDEENDPAYRLKAAHILMTNATRLQPPKQKPQPKQPDHEHVEITITME